MDEFFLNDCRSYMQQLLAVTYTFESKNETAAFFSVLNDKIINKDSRGKTITNKIIRKIPNKKRRPTYPAVKIGRLAVNTKYQKNKLGTGILDFIKVFFTKANKPGCRFITVDAYNCEEVISFYKKSGFDFLTSEDKNDETRLMYFDLLTFVR